MRNIYIVDDDESPRRGLVRLLKAGGYDASGFASGQDLLALPDAVMTNACIIMDARMASMHPTNIYTELKQRNLCPIIIMITADNRQEVRAIANQVGAVAFFTKPVDGVALLDMVAWVTRQNDHPPLPFTEQPGTRYQAGV